MPEAPAPAIQMRAGQREVFKLVWIYRLLAFVARRQYGKTTTFAQIALAKMMENRNHTVIFGSAKLNLSREIVRKEAETLEAGISAALLQLETGSFSIYDSQSGSRPDFLGHDDFAEMFEAQRLEFRYYHSRTSYSRTKVVALRPDTVGETGDLMADEVGRINNWREVYEAIEPIVASNPDFRLLLSTTPPPDDTHFSFEQLAPPPGTIFTPNPLGCVYESIREVTVFRLDAYDAALDNVPLYDLKSGKPQTPEQSRVKALDKEAWDRNYGCLFLIGGAAAIGLMQIFDAQERGRKMGCVFAEDDLPADWEKLFEPGAPVGIGADPATTDGETSNPFGICCTQRIDGIFVAKLILSFKSADPKKPKAILRELVETLRPQALVLDSTSEAFWCLEVRDELEHLTEVALLKSSERMEFNGERVLFKAYLGMIGTAPFDDGTAAIPNHKSVKDDFRLVRRLKGGFDNALDSKTGRHGDLFDAWKNSIYGLTDTDGKAEASATAVGYRRAQATPRNEQTRMRMRASEDDANQTPGNLWI